MTPKLTVAHDAAAVSELLAQDISDKAVSAVKDRDEFRLVLSGGNTPRELYRLLADRNRSAIPWESVSVFWGDERCVPPSHPDSNYAMARRELVDRVPLHEDHVHRISGEVDPPEAAASAYDSELARLARGGEPAFDLILLGLGEDGHTASLFPRSAAVDETKRWAVAIRDPGRPPLVPRVTLTLPALSSTRSLVFLVTGREKATVVERVLRSLPEGNPDLPASLIRSMGTEDWYLDRGAASLAGEYLPQENRRER